MLTWGEFRGVRPDLAEAGRADDGLFAFIAPSPKRGDLVGDGRYAMHAFPPPQNEDTVYLTGRAEARPDPALRELIASIFFGERGFDRPPGFDEEQLFEFLIDTCLLTSTTGHRDYNPKHTVWKASDER